MLKAKLLILLTVLCLEFNKQVRKFRIVMIVGNICRSTRDK